MKKVIVVISCLISVICLSGCNLQFVQDINEVSESVSVQPEENGGPHTLEDIADNQSEHNEDDDSEMTLDEITSDATASEINCILLEREDSFLEKYGLNEQEPSFTYTDEDGQLVLKFFYDEKNQLGVGIRYMADDSGEGKVLTYGFAVSATEQTWQRGSWEEYLEPVAAENIEFDENYLRDYQVAEERDANGRLTSYLSTGFYTEWEQEINVLNISYEYWENGNLKYREYFHNSLLYGTMGQSCYSWFDEQGRLNCEHTYVTHGSMDYYYAYEGDNLQPKWQLAFDNYGETFYPQFNVYTKE